MYACMHVYVCKLMGHAVRIHNNFKAAVFKGKLQLQPVKKNNSQKARITTMKKYIN